MKFSICFRQFSTRPVSSIRRPILAWGLAGLLGAAAMASDTEPVEAATPAAVPMQFELSFAGRTFPSILPFDQFYSIYGSVPQGAIEVEGFMIERSRAFRVRKNKAGRFKCFDVKKVTRDGKKVYDETPTKCEWTKLGFAELGCAKPPATATTANGVPFCFLELDPLEASRHYLFRFDSRKTLTKAQRDAFEAAAFKILDLLVTFPTGDISDQQLEKLHVDLRKSLNTVTGRQKLEFPGDGFLATRYDELTQKLKDEYIVAIRDIVKQNREIKNARQDWATNTNLLSSRLSDLRDQAKQPGNALTSLLAAVTKLAADPNNQVFATWKASFADALGVLTLNTQPQIQKLAMGLGLDPATPVPDLVNDPGAFDARFAASIATNYTGLHQQLGDLEEFLAGALSPTTFDRLVAAEGPNTGLTAADRPALDRTLELLGTIRGDAFSLRGDAASAASAFTHRTAELNELAARIRVEAARDAVLIAATTQGDYRTRQNWYLSTDLGLALTPEIDEVLRFAAMNVYLRPVNRQADFRDADSFGRRFAFTIGLTEGGLSDDPSTEVEEGSQTVGDGRTREDLFGSNSLLVGAGYRITPDIRLGLGAVVFKKKDPNPLIETESLTFTPYFSLSFDWDINNTVFKRLGLTRGTP